MARSDINDDRHGSSDSEEEARSLLSSGSDVGGRDGGVATPQKANGTPNGRPTSTHRRQSSLAQTRPNGTPRTPNRVRFDVEEPPEVEGEGRGDENQRSSFSPLSPRRREDMDWAEEEDFLERGGRRDSDTARLPLLTGIEAPSVTVATEDFSVDEMLARPKSGMSSAFMNMANSIMYGISYHILRHFNSM